MAPSEILSASPNWVSRRSPAECVCRAPGNLTPGVLGETLHWDGAEIDQGDIVVGDSDGVVVIKAFEFDTVVQAALEREAGEADMLAKLRQGATTIDLMGLKHPSVVES